MTDLTVIVPPAGEPLTLGAAKDYLRIAGTGEDALVTALIAGARAQIEAASGLALVTRTLRRRWRQWPRGLTRSGVALRPGPMTALVAVTRTDGEGGEDLLTGRFETSGGRMRLRPFIPLPIIPLDGAIEVDFETGFGAPGDVPEDLVRAVLLIVNDCYQRGAARVAGGLPEAVWPILSARQEVRL